MNNTPEAYEFLEKNFKIALEQNFLITTRKLFKSEKEFKAFIQDFNDEVTMGKKDYDISLIGFLKKYSRNWINYRRNNNGFSVIKNEPIDNRPEFKKIS